MEHRNLLIAFLIPALLLVGCGPGNVGRAEQVEAYRVTAEPAEAQPAKVPEKADPIAAVKAEVLPKDPPKDCPLTLPQAPAFTPPAPYSDLGFGGYFWHGSDMLWTSLPEDGIWADLPHNPEGLTQKIFWWSDGYVWNEEPQPKLVVTGERLDAKAPGFSLADATNAYADDIGSAMLMGVDLPTPGCWKITGNYRKTELSFVVWVAP